MIGRKWIVTLHMRSGAVHRVICRGFKIERKDGNTLSSISVRGGHLPFYVRIDAIDTIKTRRAWLRWHIDLPSGDLN